MWSWSDGRAFPRKAPAVNPRRKIPAASAVVQRDPVGTVPVAGAFLVGETGQANTVYSVTSGRQYRLIGLVVHPKTRADKCVKIRCPPFPDANRGRCDR